MRKDQFSRARARSVARTYAYISTSGDGNDRKLLLSLFTANSVNEHLLALYDAHVAIDPYHLQRTIPFNCLYISRALIIQLPFPSRILVIDTQIPFLYNLCAQRLL